MAVCQSISFSLDHLDGEPHGRHGRPLAVAGLEHEQLAVLDRELEVLHVAEVGLQRLADLGQLGERLGLLALQQRDRVGRADAGDDVLALGVHQELAVEHFFARGGVTGEGHAGARVFARVAEHHGLHVHGRAPLGGDVVLAAVDDRPVVHPAAEHGPDGPGQLLPRVVGERLAGAVKHQLLEPLDQVLEVVGRQGRVLGVGVAEQLLLGLLDDDLERLVVLVGPLLDAHDDVAVHLDEPAVAVVGEPLVAGRLGQAQHRLVVEPEVEDRVHHARHRVAGARADGDQHGRVDRVTELGAHDLLHRRDAGVHLAVQFRRVGLLVVVEVGADLGRDREPGRHRQADAAHLGQVRALAAEQGLHAAVPVALAVAERVDPLGGLHGLAGVLGNRDRLLGRRLGRLDGLGQLDGLLREGLLGRHGHGACS